mgnify:FL=1
MRNALCFIYGVDIDIYDAASEGKCVQSCTVGLNTYYARVDAQQLFFLLPKPQFEQSLSGWRLLSLGSHLPHFAHLSF